MYLTLRQSSTFAPGTVQAHLFECRRQRLILHVVLDPNVLSSVISVISVISVTVSPADEWHYRSKIRVAVAQLPSHGVATVHEELRGSPLRRASRSFDTAFGIEE